MGNRNWGFIDLRLHLSGLSWQILHALEGEPTFAEFDKEKDEYKVETETYAWYNGRERGFCLHVSHRDRLFRGNLYIAFANHKSSDHISVYNWTPKSHYLNPPGVQEMHEADAWKSQRIVKSVDEAVEYIREVLKEFLANEEKMCTVQEVLQA